MPDGPVRYPVPVGGTPLLPVPGLRQALGTPRLWVKDETRNPTASNKDRATALVIDHFGLWGTPVTPINPTRLAGAALVAAGVMLLRR